MVAATHTVVAQLAGAHMQKCPVPQLTMMVSLREIRGMRRITEIEVNIAIVCRTYTHPTDHCYSGADATLVTPDCPAGC